MRNLMIALALLCTACGSGIPWLKPYHMDIQQGNVVTPQMMMQLRPGMSKAQVRYVMGTPLIFDPFHGNRWDYFYQMRKDGKIIEQRRVILEFENEKLVRVRGDVIPAGATGLEPGAAGANEDGTTRALESLIKGEPAQPSLPQASPAAPGLAPPEVVTPVPVPAAAPAGPSAAPPAAPPAAPSAPKAAPPGPAPSAIPAPAPSPAAAPVSAPSAAPPVKAAPAPLAPAAAPATQAAPAPKPAPPAASSSAQTAPAPKTQAPPAAKPEDDLPPEEDPSYFERMLEKIGF